MLNLKSIGDYGEDIATNYFIGEGYKVLTRNFRTRTGEIDIILKKDEILCFVEVKTRYSFKFGNPCEAINMKKKAAIIKTSVLYMTFERLNNLNVRYDVIEVILNHNDDSYIINHLKNVF